MTVAPAEKKPGTPSEVVQAYQADFAAVLPSHIKPETWVRLAVGALRRDPKLTQAANNDMAALMGALLTAARLGLEPGTEQFYLVPRKDKGVLKVAGQTGYQGEIELMYRAGAISSVIVEVVREKDQFQYRPGRDERPIHDIDWDLDDRGPLRLVYAYAVMKDGATSKVVVLNKAHIEKAKESSLGSDSAYSPWVQHEESMWMKTAAHRLKKWVPTSAEYMREQIRAIHDVAAEQRPPALLTAPLPQSSGFAEGAQDEEAGEVVVGEVVDETADGLWKQIVDATPAGWHHSDLLADFEQTHGLPPGEATTDQLRAYLQQIKTGVPA